MRLTRYCSHRELAALLTGSHTLMLAWCESPCYAHLYKLQDSAGACRTYLRSVAHDHIGNFDCTHQQAATQLVAYEITHGPDGPGVRFLDGHAVEWDYDAKAQQKLVNITIDKDRNNSAGTSSHVPYLQTHIPLGMSAVLQFLRYLIEMQPP